MADRWRPTMAELAALSGADLRWADLRGCDLAGARLEGAKMRGALVDLNTVAGLAA